MKQSNAESVMMIPNVLRLLSRKRIQKQNLNGMNVDRGWR